MTISKLLSIISYPIMLIFVFLFVFPLYALCLLLAFADGTEEGTDFYEIKNDFISRFGTPKRFFVTIWELTKERYK